jgi:Major Facilitator Superfamily
MSIEARTIRKVQIRIMPFIFLLYVVAFLDRVNIGFAALTMNKELAISSQQYGLLSGIFFIGYFLFEIPSNLLMHKIGARIWIARILITWGAVAALTGFVHSAHQIVGQLEVIRVLNPSWTVNFRISRKRSLPRRVALQDRCRRLRLPLIEIFEPEIPCFPDEEQRQHRGCTIGGVNHGQVVPLVKNILTDESSQERWRDHPAQDTSQTKGYACPGISEFRGEAL